MAAPRPEGNTRTDQHQTFQKIDTVTKTRLVQDADQASAEQKAQDAAEPLDGYRDMTNLAERWGRALQVNAFIDILKRLQPKLIFELSKNYPDKIGIYVPVANRDPISRRVHVDKRHVCGMISGLEFGGIGVGYMPEFSVIVNTPEFVPTPEGTVTEKKKFAREIRGWRTVLAALIMDGLLAEAQVERTFRISGGMDSANWQRKMGGNRPIEVS